MTLQEQLTSALTKAITPAMARAFANAGADGELHDMQKATASGTTTARGSNATSTGPGEDLAKAAMIELAALTGEYDPDKLATLVEQAAAQKVSIADPRSAIALARRVVPDEPTYTWSLSDGAATALAAERAQARVEHAERQNLHKAAGQPAPVPPDTLRELRSTAAALAWLIDNPSPLKPIGHAAKPWVDNRADLREFRDHARRLGNHGGAEMYQRELDAAEAMAISTAGPTSTDTHAGRIVHRKA